MNFGEIFTEKEASPLPENNLLAMPDGSAVKTPQFWCFRSLPRPSALRCREEEASLPLPLCAVLVKSS